MKKELADFYGNYASEQETADAVSYTHLDVYKRQFLKSVVESKFQFPLRCLLLFSFYIVFADGHARGENYVKTE